MRKKETRIGWCVGNFNDNVGLVVTNTGMYMYLHLRMYIQGTSHVLRDKRLIFGE